MVIGIPKERQTEEYRVPVLPEGVRHLVENGHRVFVENGAGEGSGFPDSAYAQAGARMAANGADLLGEADFIVKVKEPIPEEFDQYRANQALFCYLYTEKRPQLLDMLLKKRITAIAFENVRLSDGTCPLLRPMSIIAGQQSVLQGMQFLCNHRNGVGKSLIRFPGLPPARVVVLGAGQVGLHAATTAAALGADVYLFEKNSLRIARIAPGLPSNVHLLQIDAVFLETYVCKADLVINAATVPPQSSRHLIDRPMISKMQKGSVIVDVTVFLEGAVETIDRYSSHADPVWEVDGVIHYAVPNIPGTVARTASQALSLEVLPYVLEIADHGIPEIFSVNPILLQAVSTANGTLTWQKAGEFQNRPWCPPEKALGDAPG